VKLGSSHQAGSVANATEGGTGQWLMHGITSEHQEPVLPELGIQLIFRIRVDCYSKIRKLKCMFEVPEVRLVNETHFFKHY